MSLFSDKIDKDKEIIEPIQEEKTNENNSNLFLDNNLIFPMQNININLNENESLHKDLKNHF